MRLAIMQPYFFPYVGYFQLAQAVDRFVFYDDVQFIKNGWINRNRILTDSGVAYLTIPITNGSMNHQILEVMPVISSSRFGRKLSLQLQHAYKKTPNYDVILPLIEKVMFKSGVSIAELASDSVRSVFAYLGCGPEWVTSSGRAYGNEALSGQDRIIDICKREGAQEYVNLAGGAALYDPVAFQEQGIELSFLHPRIEPYSQLVGEFVPGLSIIDLMMRLSGEEIRHHLLR
jgi:hypothetical protein